MTGPKSLHGLHADNAGFGKVRSGGCVLSIECESPRWERDSSLGLEGDLEECGSSG